MDAEECEAEIQSYMDQDDGTTREIEDSSENS